MKPWNYARKERHCIQCNGLFLAPPSDPAKHCGDVCSRKTQSEKRYKPRECVICHCSFIGTATKTCGRACLSKLRTGIAPINKGFRRIRACEICGTTMIIGPTTVLRKFCSRKCKGIATSRRVHHRIRYDKQCDECGHQFQIVNARRLIARFCCKQCADRHKSHTTGPSHKLWKPKSQRICEWCHRPFETKPAKVAMGEGRFCSRRCLGSFCVSIQTRPSSLEVNVATLLDQLEEPYEKQKPIGPWIVDFYLPRRHLVIECDGIYWHTLPRVMARDRQKNGWLKMAGFNILRLPEKEIRTGLAKAVIQEAFA